MSDRVIVMAKGSVQQCDTPGAIYRKPANRFVASFVGRLPMNFIEGELVDEGSGLRFRSGSLAVDLAAVGHLEKGRVVLGVRRRGLSFGVTATRGPRHDHTDRGHRSGRLRDGRGGGNIASDAARFRRSDATR